MLRTVGLLPQLCCATALWACYRTCGHCMRMRMRCATHCGLLPQLWLCYALWLLPQLVWCCRTLGVLPHALCVLAHTWRSAATAAPLSWSRSRSLLCSSQPRPNGLWAERSRAESREQRPRPQPSATLRRTWSLAIVVVCGTSHLRVELE